MSSTLESNRCDQSAQVSAYVMQTLPPEEAAAVEAHLASCCALPAGTGDIAAGRRHLRILAD